MSRAHDLPPPKVLREAGIITGDRRGTWVYNRPVPASLQQLAALLDAATLTGA
ncbi:hypothetical protein ACFQX7_27070 [Luedemannella flava]